ncbi:hypothetical protein ACLOJK_006452, partial [Asimina triloba]
MARSSYKESDDALIDVGGEIVRKFIYGRVSGDETCAGLQSFLATLTQGWQRLFTERSGETMPTSIIISPLQVVSSYYASDGAQPDLAVVGGCYGILSNVLLSAPELHETPRDYRLGHICLYESMLKAEVRIPFKFEIAELLQYFHVASMCITIHSWKTIQAVHQTSVRRRSSEIWCTIIHTMATVVNLPANVRSSNQTRPKEQRRPSPPDPANSVVIGHLYVVQIGAEKSGFIFFGKRQWQHSSNKSGSPLLQQLRQRPHPALTATDYSGKPSSKVRQRQRHPPAVIFPKNFGNRKIGRGSERHAYSSENPSSSTSSSNQGANRAAIANGETGISGVLCSFLP